MKKFICFLMLFMVAFITPMMAMAETVASSVVETPTSFDLQTYFVSLAGLVSAVIALTQVLKPFIGTSGFWTKALSWIIAGLVSVVGYFLQLGVFVGMEWYWMLIYALSSGLVANGIFDLGIVQAIINLFKLKIQ